MTEIEQAIEQLERISHKLGNIGETSDYTEMAIEALEKQIPKKPHKINADEYKNKIINYKVLRGAASCPNCRIVFRSGSYCDNCGQKLDWSEEE